MEISIFHLFVDACGQVLCLPYRECNIGFGLIGLISAGWSGQGDIRDRAASPRYRWTRTASTRRHRARARDVAIACCSPTRRPSRPLFRRYRRGARRRQISLVFQYMSGRGRRICGNCRGAVRRLRSQRRPQPVAASRGCEPSAAASRSNRHRPRRSLMMASRGRRQNPTASKRRPAPWSRAISCRTAFASAAARASTSRTSLMRGYWRASSPCARTPSAPFPPSIPSAFMAMRRRSASPTSCRPRAAPMPNGVASARRRAARQHPADGGWTGARCGRSQRPRRARPRLGARSTDDAAGFPARRRRGAGAGEAEDGRRAVALEHDRAREDRRRSRKTPPNSKDARPDRTKSDAAIR